MTRRERLLMAVKKHLIKELVEYYYSLSFEQVEKRTNAIMELNKRLPHITKPPPRISSQRKLFY